MYVLNRFKTSPIDTHFANCFAKSYILNNPVYNPAENRLTLAGDSTHMPVSAARVHNVLEVGLKNTTQWVYMQPIFNVYW